MSEAFIEYKAKLIDYLVFQKENDWEKIPPGETSEQEDKLLDRMDVLWWEMTDSEREAFQTRSVDLGEMEPEG